MSQHHRNNPDSEECQQMAKDNELDIKARQHMATLSDIECLRCGQRIAKDYITRTGLCEDCDFENEP